MQIVLTPIQHFSHSILELFLGAERSAREDGHWFPIIVEGNNAWGYAFIPIGL
jgi:hypothetical protein